MIAERIKAGDRLGFRSLSALTIGVGVEETNPGKRNEKNFRWNIFFLDLACYPCVYISHYSLYCEFPFNMFKFHDTNHDWVFEKIIVTLLAIILYYSLVINYRRSWTWHSKCSQIKSDVYCFIKQAVWDIFFGHIIPSIYAVEYLKGYR